MSRPTSAAYYRPRSAARPSSTGSIRPPSASIRPSTDPTKADLLGSHANSCSIDSIFDWIIDNSEDVVSELTIGPAFQGNLTKILRARKQQQQSQQMTDAPPVTTVEKSKAPSPAPAPSRSSSSAIGASHPLMKEINEWTIEHNRYEFDLFKTFSSLLILSV